ncbi:uncharacterized protein PGTG_22343 [Puccinia graminis f. sp. tritici CRL 75-36-700-3]|uniref:Uncharacterized protein n=1 Tax=Puccinia graminis f. sp. tritici (strain CRL 75-36-700-3 / race SCCL) TaxID=418459 RepID=H6QUJ5_PUCGT|nr:uncharacterized protein PGTG_22343 [Puccinia graminis f. sp. tritici CRL 75-36-700-3]EHS64707.1 hypothetical protein PGTG_22343 [Puccinia graminis f. sp. tritici CRL 75-36-700-3]
MDAYATTILDTQDSVLQQNIHPQVGCSSLPVNGVEFFFSLNNNLSANRCGIYLFVDEVPSSEDDDPLQRAELLIISLGEEDPFGQAGTSCMLAEVYPLHRAMSVEYRPDTGLVRRGRHILAEQAQAIPLPARSDCRRDSK